MPKSNRRTKTPERKSNSPTKAGSKFSVESLVKEAQQNELRPNVTPDHHFLFLCLAQTLLIYCVSVGIDHHYQPPFPQRCSHLLLCPLVRFCDLLLYWFVQILRHHRRPGIVVHVLLVIGVVLSCTHPSPTTGARLCCIVGREVVGLCRWSSTRQRP